MHYCLCAPRTLCAPVTNLEVLLSSIVGRAHPSPGGLAFLPPTWIWLLSLLRFVIAHFLEHDLLKVPTYRANRRLHRT